MNFTIFLSFFELSSSVDFVCKGGSKHMSQGSRSIKFDVIVSQLLDKYQIHNLKIKYFQNELIQNLLREINRWNFRLKRFYSVQVKI